ncbi:MAG: winged helix-turn-helix domain-containing protein [Crocinitomicaceae bacterium]|nr:winged helix-turn-helix domain-containing protein [Crocinitomicaceae bacterium]
MKALLSLLLLLPTVFFGQNDSTGVDEEVPQKLPPMRMLSGEGEAQNFFELEYEADYQVFDQMGALVEEGHGEFIDYTDYEGGTYFVSYDDKTQFFKHTPPEKSYFIYFMIGGIILVLIIGVLILREVRFRAIHNNLVLELEAQKKKISEVNLSELEEKNQPTLDKKRIELAMESQLNESDWRILNALVEEPSLSNKALAVEVALSIEGTRSSLKKMYRLLEIPSSRNMRLNLVMAVLRISKNIS